MKKDFSELTEQEVLALAISLEEEDIRSYGDFAEAMRESYPGTARMFAAMAEEENGHRHRLLDLYREKFGEHIPLIRRQDVKGFLDANRAGFRARSGSTKCAPRRNSWRPRASASTKLQHGARPMPPCVSFWAISRQKNAGTRRAPKRLDAGYVPAALSR